MFTNYLDTCICQLWVSDLPNTHVQPREISTLNYQRCCVKNIRKINVA